MQINKGIPTYYLIIDKNMISCLQSPCVFFSFFLLYLHKIEIIHSCFLAKFVTSQNSRYLTLATTSDTAGQAQRPKYKWPQNTQSFEKQSKTGKKKPKQNDKKDKIYE